MYQYFEAEYFQQIVSTRVFQAEYFQQRWLYHFQAAKIAHNLVGAVPASEPLGESRHNSAANIHGA